MTSAVDTLAEAARELAEAQRAREEADAEVERLRVPYEAAIGRAYSIESRIRRIESGIAAARRAYGIVRAIEEQAIETSEPPLVVLPPRFEGEKSPPDVYELVAVAADGAGLYRTLGESKGARRRYGGRSHAIFAEHVPDDLPPHRPGIDGSTDKRMEQVGIAAWEERGRGDFGAHSR